MWEILACLAGKAGPALLAVLADLATIIALLRDLWGDYKHRKRMEAEDEEGADGNRPL